MRISWILAFAILALPGLGQAAELYLTPSGAGRKDGTAWEHAFDQPNLSRVVNEVMQPGDRLHLGGGAYQGAQLKVTKGGAKGSPKTIVGVDRGQGLPVFTSSWSEDDPDQGATAVRIEPGVGHWVFEALRMEGYQFCVLVPPGKNGATCSQLTFKDVDMDRFRHGFYLSNCADLRLQDCDLRRYTKHGFRFEQGCTQVTVRGCTADCSLGDAAWETKTELFPFGFIVNSGGAPNSGFVFEDCLARNHQMPLQKKSYKNGDGFVVEGNTTDVQFVRCRAIRNQDGGFDLKVADVNLTDCVALGNSRNIRIWKNATLNNCFSGWASTGLWCNGGPIEVNRSTFHELKKAAVQTDDKATEPVTLHSCLITACAAVHAKTARGKTILEDSVVIDATNEKSPSYVHENSKWDGLGPAMNSRNYPDKGYHQTSDP